MSMGDVILSQHYTEGHPLWIDFAGDDVDAKVRYYPEKQCTSRHDSLGGFHCSRCGCSYPKIVDDRGFIIATLYCPSCGARRV